MTFPYKSAVVQALYPVRRVWNGKAFVCGGFVRDAVLGVKPKDIDIFIFAPGSDRAGWHSPLASLENLRRQLDDEGIHCKPLDPDFTYPMEEGGTEVVGVLELRMPVYGLPVQIIMVDGFSEETILDRFDYGACRAMTDGKDIWTHPHFREDIENKVFRLRRPREDMCLMSSVERYARFKAREEFYEWKWHPFNPEWGGDPFREEEYFATGNNYQPRKKVAEYEIDSFIGAIGQ